MLHSPLQHQRGPTAALPVLEAGLRLLLRLAAPGPDGSPGAAHRLFVLNALPRLAQVRAAGFGALTDSSELYDLFRVVNLCAASAGSGAPDMHFSTRPFLCCRQLNVHALCPCMLVEPCTCCVWC